MKITKNSPILNSAIKAWNGEEKLWKVFWLWGVLLYISSFCVISFGNGFLESLSYDKLDNLNILIAIFALFYYIFIFLIYPIIFLIALNRCCHNKFSKVAIKLFSIFVICGFFLFAIIEILTLFITIKNSGDANMFNKFKKGFYFEKYETAEEAKTALLKLHPIGSDVGELIKNLDIATDKDKIYNKSTDKIEDRISKSKNGSYFYFSYNKLEPLSLILIYSIEWRVIVYVDTEDHSVIKEITVYKFFHTL